MLKSVDICADTLVDCYLHTWFLCHFVKQAASMVLHCRQAKSYLFQAELIKVLNSLQNVRVIVSSTLCNVLSGEAEVVMPSFEKYGIVVPCIIIII